MDTFTKFDHLGSALAEVSYKSISLHMSRHDSGIRYLVYLHREWNESVSGDGDTPSAALADALARQASKEAAEALAAVEAAARQVAA